MSDYTKTTNFTAKDSLLTGDPNKIVSGADFDLELNAIATAIASKLDAASAALTGTTTAETIQLDNLRIQDTAQDNYVTFDVGSDLAGNVTITIPALTSGDTLVFNDFAATLTNKTINLSSNTLSGTAAEFDTACSDDNFLFVSDLIDDDTFATATATNVASAESVKAYVDANVGGGGGGTVDTAGTPVTNDFARFTDADTIEGRSYAEVRSDLGLVIGTNVQAYDAGLADIAGLAVTDGNIIVGDGANWVAESGATARTSLGLAIGTNVQAQSSVLQDLADSLTSTAAELNVLDGVTAGTAAASKGVVLDSNGDIVFPEEVTVKSLNETAVTFTSSANACTINCELGNSFSHTRTENTTLTISNPPASGKEYSMYVEIINDAGASGYTFAWPASVQWPGGVAPTLSTGASDKDVFILKTNDGGTTYEGNTFGLDFS